MPWSISVLLVFFVAMPCSVSAPFVPFVAGVAAMTPSRFIAYNVLGGLIWVCGLTLAGYLFGETAFVKAHLSQIIWAMIFVPGLFALWGAWRAQRS